MKIEEWADITVKALTELRSLKGKDAFLADPDIRSATDPLNIASKAIKELVLSKGENTLLRDYLLGSPEEMTIVFRPLFKGVTKPQIHIKLEEWGIHDKTTQKKIEKNISKVCSTVKGVDILVNGPGIDRLPEGEALLKWILEYREYKIGSRTFCNKKWDEDGKPCIE